MLCMLTMSSVITLHGALLPLDNEFSGQRIRPVQTFENLKPLSGLVPVRR